MPLASSPGYNITPTATKVALSTNYITNFDFLNQYLPELYEKEFERYGNRTIASFLRMVSAELPFASDQIKWTEQGRLHIKYKDVAPTVGLTGALTGTFTINDVSAHAIRVGQTVVLNPLLSHSTTSPTPVKGIVTDIPLANRITVAFYNASGITATVDHKFTLFIYGSEFKKGTNGMSGSLEAQTDIFENSPIILKDLYEVNGSDMAQIGWVEVTTENGASGYLWYLKSEHEARLRFDDYLETSMLEAVPAEPDSGAEDAGYKGSEGVFHAINTRGNVFIGIPSSLSDFDSIVARLDKQGAIEENVLFVNREMSFEIDDMLAGLNGLGSSTGAANFASFGLFDNNKDMALNLGFTGFRRGYDFYKSDWKYLNDPTMRGDLAQVTSAAGNTTAGVIFGMLAPAGSTTVYDQVLGKNAKRPFLHVRYRASEAEDRRYKSWVTGSAGGANTSDLDAMQVHFLSERCVCTLGANNFFLFRGGA